jgi:hypothetical protein
MLRRFLLCVVKTRQDNSPSDANGQNQQREPLLIKAPLQ